MQGTVSESLVGVPWALQGPWKRRITSKLLGDRREPKSRCELHKLGLGGKVKPRSFTTCAGGVLQGIVSQSLVGIPWALQSPWKRRIASKLLGDRREPKGRCDVPQLVVPFYNTGCSRVSKGHTTKTPTRGNKGIVVYHSLLFP